MIDLASDVGLTVALTLLGAVVFVVLTGLRAAVSQEVKEDVPIVLRWLVLGATRLIPRPMRARYQQDWLTDLERLESRPISAFLWAVTLYRAGWAEGRDLRRLGSTEVPAPAILPLNEVPNAADIAVVLPPAPVGPRVDEEPVLGIPLALTDYVETLDWIDATVASRNPGYICVAGVHTVVACHDDPELREAVFGADFTVPAGQPLVWAMNMLGHHLPSRVYGPELMDRACARASVTGLRMFLYGGRNPGALAQLALNLRRKYPGLQIVGGYAPPYRELNDEEKMAIVEEINRSGADLVWVGIGVPKQEKWMWRMRDKLDAPVLVGVGAAFDFHAGLVPHAPDWMQRFGLDWAYRVAHEPRRLWKRYARYNPRFVGDFARQYARYRVARASDLASEAPSSIMNAPGGELSAHRLHGDIEQRDVEATRPGDRTSMRQSQLLLIVASGLATLLLLVVLSRRPHGRRDAAAGDSALRLDVS